jgi:predicted transcriptional regulator of viral defense system
VGKVEDRLRELASEHGGYFLAAEASERGTPRPLIVQLANRQRIERVSRGLYRFVSWPPDPARQYHEATLWARAQRGLRYAIVSHQSALELYGLTDANPSTVHVTIPPGTRIRRDVPKWITFHWASVPPGDQSIECGVDVASARRAIEDTATVLGSDGVHQAVAQARQKNLLREDELDQLTRLFGEGILEPYDGR